MERYSNMLAVHFGAGNIGRGFVGEVLNNNGYKICFVDVQQSLIDEINKKNSYQIELAQEKEESIEINDVYALNSQENKAEVVDTIARADLVTVSVGVSILPFIAPVLAAGLEQRVKAEGGPLHVIACENAVGASTTLKQAVKEELSESSWARISEMTGFPDAAVDRIVPNQRTDGSLDVKVEPFFEWIVEQQGMVKEENLTGIKYVKNLTPYIERKLFTVNTGHACIAYLGFINGQASVAEALADESIRAQVEGALNETGRLLEEKYQFSNEEMELYHNKIIERFENTHLSDPVERVGRNPLRKLKSTDRLISPLSQLHQRGIEAPHLITVAAAAFLFDVQEDEESVKLQEMVDELGIEKTIQQVTDLPDELVSKIEKEYMTLKSR
ncbi:mannitol-1-phosphate 5-dehydrogenase [Thalassorhabdus alkalitolerans]|uniref:Mannitol-1-phosphate 5-dehydrogenase n=2 Tax=Thalassorhabdus alkalitolerans TaxID=2282697 RepID=A0ABW0YI82_9BACI